MRAVFCGIMSRCLRHRHRRCLEKLNDWGVVVDGTSPSQSGFCLWKLCLLSGFVCFMRLLLSLVCASCLCLISGCLYPVDPASVLNLIICYRELYVWYSERNGLYLWLNVIRFYIILFEKFTTHVHAYLNNVNCMRKWLSVCVYVCVYACCMCVCTVCVYCVHMSVFCVVFIFNYLFSIYSYIKGGSFTLTGIHLLIFLFYHKVS